MGCAFAKLSTKGIVPNADDVVHEPFSNHVTASPLWPAIVIAARAFSEKVATRVAPPLWKRSSSANAGTRIRQAESPFGVVPPPYAMFLAFGSSVQVTIFCESRSHQAFATMPCVA